jgi:hypothetical protein
MCTDNVTEGRRIEDEAVHYMGFDILLFGDDRTSRKCRTPFIIPSCMARGQHTPQASRTQQNSHRSKSNDNPYTGQYANQGTNALRSLSFVCGKASSGFDSVSAIRVHSPHAGYGFHVKVLLLPRHHLLEAGRTLHHYHGQTPGFLLPKGRGVPCLRSLGGAPPADPDHPRDAC